MKDGLLKCSRHCMNNEIECDNNECRLWIDYKEEYNCSLISIYEHGPMTLVFVKVKTVEALKEALFARRTAVWGIIFLSAKKNI